MTLYWRALRRLGLFVLILALSPLAGQAQTPSVVRSQHAPQAVERNALIDASQRPWSAIGRVSLAGKSFCTGFLIAPQYVITAAHCLYNAPARRWWLPAAVHFQAGYQFGRQQGHSRIAKITIAPGYQPKNPLKLTSLPHDWALLTLITPLGQRLGWLPLANKRRPGATATGTDPEETLLIAGYGALHPHALALESHCQRINFADRDIQAQQMLVHTCGYQQGMSGAPVLRLTPQTISVIAVQSTGLTFPNLPLALRGKKISAATPLVGRAITRAQPLTDAQKALALLHAHRVLREGDQESAKRQARAASKPQESSAPRR